MYRQLRAYVLLLAFAGCVLPQCDGADRPNILFLFADDQSYQTINATGNDEVQTPHIDSLYERGTSYRHTYNLGGWNGAICIASRTMLNTGLYLWHAERAEPSLKEEWVPQRKMWAQQMADAGYQTFFSGKWHVKADPETVFEVCRHVRGGMPKQTDEGYDRPRSRDDKEWLPWDRTRGGFWEGGKHWSEVLGDDAVDYLQTASRDERPFFMYLAFNAPHDPRQSPEEFVQRYPAESILVPTSFLPEYPYDIGSNKVRDELLAPFPRTEYSVQVNRQEYYAIITHMDQQIGRILAALEATGQADNTWIFFTADHGLACGHHGLMGKQNMFEHSVRVPFVAVGPGVTAGRALPRRILLQDVMPTSLELAGAPIPEHVQFASRVAELTSEPDVETEAAAEPTGTIYGGYTRVQRMVVDGHHKLILYPKIRTSLLFDLQADPEELIDLSNQDGSQAIKRRLFRLLLEEQKKTGDDLDLTTPFSELAATP